MADDNETPPAPVIHEGMSKSEVAQALKTHKDEINNLFDERDNKLREELRQLGSGDTEEKEQTKEDIKTLKDWRAAELKKAEDAAASNKSEHTVVVPAANLEPPTGDQQQQQETPRKKGWRDFF